MTFSVPSYVSVSVTSTVATPVSSQDLSSVQSHPSHSSSQGSDQFWVPQVPPIPSTSLFLESVLSQEEDQSQSKESTDSRDSKASTISEEVIGMNHVNQVQ